MITWIDPNGQSHVYEDKQLEALKFKNNLYPYPDGQDLSYHKYLSWWDGKQWYRTDGQLT